MITLYLVSAEFSSVCLFHCDADIADLVANGEDQVIGRVEPYARGSIAYDDHLKKAVWSGSEWVSVEE